MKGDALKDYLGKLVSVCLVDRTDRRFYGKISAYDDDFVTLNPHSTEGGSLKELEKIVIGSSKNNWIVIGRRSMDTIVPAVGLR